MACTGSLTSCRPPVRAFAQQRQSSIRPVCHRRSIAACSCNDETGSTDSPDSSRRQALLATVASVVGPAGLSQLATALPAEAGLLDIFGGGKTSNAPTVDTSAPVGFKSMYDPKLAYKFVYPVQTAAGEQLGMVLTRPPEKYSSAAPLSADARQRIVSELVDLRRFVTVSVTVGPAGGVLKDTLQNQWKPREVALTVLVDRSTARTSTGQRTALNDIEEAHAEERNGQTYYVYEHTTQGSPTISSSKQETFRHALAVTTTRPGLDGRPYLYTLNLSCPQVLWNDLSNGFKTAVDSFQLVATTNAYIPPDKDPWLFF